MHVYLPNLPLATSITLAVIGMVWVQVPNCCAEFNLCQYYWRKCFNFWILEQTPGLGGDLYSL